MAGIYIHIPFCKRACHYCNFHFSTSLKLKNDFFKALLKEISIRKNYLGKEIIDTIYFGGGTPSILSHEEVYLIMESINKHFLVNPLAEITLEANPDNITRETLKEWKGNHINRLSIGVQSFSEDDLKWMNRAHNAQQAIECIDDAHEEGFNNISIDLIYGTPHLTDKKWVEHLEKATNLHIPHLSCYALTVEPGTALEVMTRQKKISPINNEDQARQFLIMTDYLSGAGYEHYEISNLALPGKKSQHNSAYWSGAKYLGLGPSAHSFNGNSRQWNVANNALYIQSLVKNEIPYELEQLSEKQKYNEYIMTSLRTQEGIDLNKAGESTDLLLKAIEPYINKNWVIIENNSICLTREGKLFADGIAADLFIV